MKTVAHLLSTVLLLAIFLNPRQAAAQVDGQEFVNAHGDFFHLFFAEKSDILLKYRYEPGHQAKDSSDQFDLSLFSAALELPQPLSVDTFIRWGAEYEMRNYDFDFSSSSILEDSSERFHKAVLSLGFGHFFSNNFLFLGGVSAGAYSNFKGGIDEDDLNLLGEAILVYRINPGAQLLLGAALSEDFDDQQVIPLVGLRLLSEDGKIHISLTAPVELRIGYRMNSIVEFYGGGWISGDQYRIKIDRHEFDVQVHDRRVGLGTLFHFGQYVRLSLEVGASIESEFEFKHNGLDSFEGELDSGPYVSAALGFSL